MSLTTFRRSKVSFWEAVEDIKDFKVNLEDFANDWKKKGPGVPGLAPKEAVERLRVFKAEFEIRERKRDLYAIGEKLYALLGHLILAWTK